MDDKLHIIPVQRLGNCSVDRLEQFHKGIGTDERGVLSPPVVIQHQRLNAGIVGQLHTFQLNGLYFLFKNFDLIRLQYAVHQGIFHEPGIPQGGKNAYRRAGNQKLIRGRNTEIF